MRTANIVLELQPTIPAPPISLNDMYRTACSADGVTMDFWCEKWLANIRANRAKCGLFSEQSLGQVYGIFAGKPCIIAGSGPSLKRNIGQLKHRDKDSIKLVSCLHNFHFMEDHGAEVDFYVSLDGGPVTVEEVSEGGTKSAEEYWDLTKNRTLLAYIGTDPMLIEKWQGQVLFFNAPIPNNEFRSRVAEIEPFHQWVSNGGNVLGACLYIAKGYLGSQTTIFIGADFSFSNEEHIKFHAWDSKYDQSIGNTMRAVDIFGNSCKTWPSYWNFKLWFEYVVSVMPGIYINATEGGIFGAYREGNIESLKQMELAKVIDMFSIHAKLKHQALNSSVYARESDIILV